MADPTPSDLLGLVDVYIAERLAGGVVKGNTAAVERSVLRRFAAAHAGLRPSEVSADDVRRYLAGSSTLEATRRAYANRLRVFWRWLIVNGHARDNPVASRALPRRRPGPSTRPVNQIVHSYLLEQIDSGRWSETSLPSRRGALRMFFDDVRKRPEDVTRQDVKEFLGRPGLAPATRRQRLVALRGFFDWAIENGYAMENPTAGHPRIREPRALPRGLRPEQVRRLLDVVPDVRGRLIVLLEVQCGLRACEVARLQAEHVDWDDRTLFVESGKGGHQRLLPIPDEAWEALEAYRREEPQIINGGPLLRSRGNRSDSLCAPYVAHLVQGWMKAAGIDEGGHALRHTFASDLLRRGVHVRDVQTALGHSNIAVTSRYLPTNVGDLRDAMNGRRYSDPPTPVVPPPAASVALDATGPLIDTVAALAAAVARIEARLGSEAVERVPHPPTPPQPKASCDLCGVTMSVTLLEGHRRLHCPECGHSLYNRRAWLRHRWEQHGTRATAEELGCQVAAVAHEHSPTGRCICPHCGQVMGTIFAVAHFTREHTPCSDCDGAYISLPRHRQRAHPWAS